MTLTENEVRSLFTLSGFSIGQIWELRNIYWPEHPDFYEDIIKSPWWLVQTEYGNIEIGWRKRVINIDWRSTGIREIVTEDNTTKSSTMVHAWNYADALKYLTELKRIAKNTKHISISFRIEEMPLIEKVHQLANNALYFADSSDYYGYLRDILYLVSPESFEDDCPKDLKLME